MKKKKQNIYSHIQASLKFKDVYKKFKIKSTMILVWY